MEIATLIIAGVSLVVMLVTLFVTCKMLKYMKESDIVKSEKSEERRRMDILARIESKEEQLKKIRPLADISGSGYRPQVEKLENDISELRNML